MGTLITYILGIFVGLVMLVMLIALIALTAELVRMEMEDLKMYGDDEKIFRFWGDKKGRDGKK